MRLSLFTKILLWFFLNLLALTVAFVLLLIFNQQLPTISRAFNDSSNAIRAVAQLISEEVREKNTAERNQILERFADAYQMEFLLYTNRGEKVAGKDLPLPPEILEHITAPPPRPRLALPPPHIREERRPPPFPLMKFQTDSPRRYWGVVRIPLYEKGQPDITRACIIAVSESRSGHGLFFDPIPWVAIGLAMLILSIMLWVPFVRSLTKALKQMTSATEQIAIEQFDVRVDEKRHDEIGRLGKAINHLATRLSGFVQGQKRFLGDISHELNSPLARMQFALSILEDRVAPQHRAYVTDVQEEVQVMTRLVSELLAYSKAGMKTAAIQMEPVRLRQLVQQVITREAAQNDQIKNEIEEATTVIANPELLARALANVIRNALRYADVSGTIHILARQQGKFVKLCISDNGPGVPDEALDKVFDPFYRLEADRARNTGGAGLGLAIVKACIEACQGTVFARNRKPSGLEVVITLKTPA